MVISVGHVLTILDHRLEALIATTTHDQQWIVIRIGNINHKVAERMLSLLNLESSESVKHTPCDFDFSSMES